MKYERRPSIASGILTISGSTKNRVRFDRDRDLSVQIFYDAPPHSLTRGQVARTYCYSAGLKTAALRRPLTGNSYYAEDEFTQTYKACPNPYDISADAPAPRSHDEANAFWKAAYDASQTLGEESITVPWITALEWTADGADFSVKADLSDVIAHYGRGVYTVVVWGNMDGEDVVISEYSIFEGVTPPDTYGRW